MERRAAAERGGPQPARRRRRDGPGRPRTRASTSPATWPRSWTPPRRPPAADDEFQYSVEDVFSQFKKGVEETVKPEDSDTHYDLGIAYKEMGLLDDAVHEFETALRGTSGGARSTA